MARYDVGVTYGIGGWMPSKPGENITERVVDLGNGVGERITYSADGSVASTTPCEVAAVVLEQSPEQRIAELEATVEQLKALLPEPT